MTSTPENDETRMYLRETRTKIKTIEKEIEKLDGIRNIRIKILKNTVLTPEETIQKEDYDKFNKDAPKLQTAKRKGVWFTKNSMEKWLSRLGLPRGNYHARTSTSGSSALLRHRAMSWSTPHLPTARCNAPNLLRRICRFL